MKLRFIKEEMVGKLIKDKTIDLEGYGIGSNYNVISYIFNELEIEIVLINTGNNDKYLTINYRDLIRFKPRDGLRYPLEVFIENKNYDSEEYYKEVQEIIDNNTETILKGLVTYHQGKVNMAQNVMFIKQDELNVAQTNYNKLLEYYSSELLFV